jgi:hypothetical protein
MTAPNAPEGKAGAGDLAEIFYAPSAVFVRRSDGSWGLPYVAAVVVAIILFIATKNLLQPIMDAEISRNLAAAAAKNHLPPEQVEQMRGTLSKLASFGVVGFYLIGPFLLALVIWIGGKIAKIPAVGTVAIMVATFSIYPRLIGNIVGAGLAAMVPEGATVSLATVSLSPARFVDVAAHPVLWTFLGRFDLFILWGYVLVAIGLRVAGKGTKGQAQAVAIGMWSLATLFALYGVLKNL